jgi:hypothetical protein
MVPGQYRADKAGSNIGTERLYSSLDFAVYHAPFTATDFIAPSIWQVDAFSTTATIVFRARVSDDSSLIQRVVVLYRRTNTNAWSKVDLTYNPLSGWATGSVGMAPAPIEYFVQAVDSTGNVALVLDHGNAFTQVRNGKAVFLPLIRK